MCPLYTHYLSQSFRIQAKSKYARSTFSKYHRCINTASNPNKCGNPIMKSRSAHAASTFPCSTASTTVGFVETFSVTNAAQEEAQSHLLYKQDPSI